MLPLPKTDLPLCEDSPLVRAIRTEFPECLAVHVFGSRVTNDATKRSDLDLAVLLPGYADPTRLWNLSASLAEIAGCDVDLIDMRAASTVMQHQILMNGRRLLAKQPQADLFECFVLSEKTALDEARAGLLQDIGERGKIYG
jgi:predicted nucleotidyltransferase